MFQCDKCERKWTDEDCTNNSPNCQKCPNPECGAEVYPDQLLKKVDQVRNCGRITLLSLMRATSLAVSRESNPRPDEFNQIK